jgi:hypothetical protein
MDQLQNALARLGAEHLVESDDVLVSERLAEVNAVLREVLVDPRSSRLVTALAPVMVARAKEVRLPMLDDQLTKIGLQHRLGWVVENTCHALEELAAHRGAPRSVLLRRRRASALLQPWLRAAKDRAPRSSDVDILDPSIRSDETAAEMIKSGSNESRFWGVVSPLMPSDFANAIEAADAGH